MNKKFKKTFYTLTAPILSLPIILTSCLPIFNFKTDNNKINSGNNSPEETIEQKEAKQQIAQPSEKETEDGEVVVENQLYNYSDLSLDKPPSFIYTKNANLGKVANFVFDLPLLIYKKSIEENKEIDWLQNEYVYKYFSEVYKEEDLHSFEKFYSNYDYLVNSFKEEDLRLFKNAKGISQLTLDGFRFKKDRYFVETTTSNLTNLLTETYELNQAGKYEEETKKAATLFSPWIAKEVEQAMFWNYSIKLLNFLNSFNNNRNYLYGKFFQWDAEKSLQENIEKMQQKENDLFETELTKLLEVLSPTHYPAKRLNNEISLKEAGFNEKMVDSGQITTVDLPFWDQKDFPANDSIITYQRLWNQLEFLYLIRRATVDADKDFRTLILEYGFDKYNIAKDHFFQYELKNKDFKTIARTNIRELDFNLTKEQAIEKLNEWFETPILVDKETNLSATRKQIFNVKYNGVFKPKKTENTTSN